MTEPEKLFKISVEDYLAHEERAQQKHEYVDGQIFAMTGATNAHGAIAVNIATSLKSKIAGSGCRIYIADTKVFVKDKNAFYYPDVVIDCGTFVPKGVCADMPAMIFEVLSPSTASIDRREKLFAYRTLESLNTYAVVHQSRRQIDVYSRSGSDWTKKELVGNGELKISLTDSCEVSLTIEEIYEGLDLEPPPELQLRETEGIYTW